MSSQARGGPLLDPPARDSDQHAADQHAFASGGCAGLFDARRTVPHETGKLRAVMGLLAKPEDGAGLQARYF
jgi:hypothetical protein